MAAKVVIKGLIIDNCMVSVVSITRETIKVAPEEIPRIKGPTTGLRKKTCKSRPETARNPPQRTPAKALGNRIFQTIRLSVEPFGEVMMFHTSDTESGILPEQILTTIMEKTASANREKISIGGLEVMASSMFVVSLIIADLHYRIGFW
jgi:hypothetical protein